MKYYPKDRILIITKEELKHSREETLKTIFRYLGVDDSFYSDCFTTVMKNKAEIKRRPINNLGWAARKFTYKLSFRKGSKMARLLYRFITHCSYYLFSKPIKRPWADESLRRNISEYLRDDINRFREFTGKKFESWNI